MKRLYPFVLAGMMLMLASCHNDLWNSINDLQSRVEKLEVLCNTLNTNIDALQVVINAQNTGDMISNVSEITHGGSVIGYTITFTSGKTITIYNGTDGADGKDGANGQNGYTPSIGVAKDTDGIYYWTLDGTWLLDADGNKLPVTGAKGDKGDKGDTGKDGQDGTNGQNGKDGTNGQDGVTPQLKIMDGYWYVSYDNGTNWTKLGKATGDDGKDGTNGTDGAKGDTGDKGDKGDAGDSMFSAVTQDSNNVYFTLSDGTIITIAKGSGSSDTTHADSDIIEFKDLNVKSALLLHTPVIDTNGDGEISYGEARAATRISIKNNQKITSFTELKYFTNITSVCFYGCGYLFEVSLPENLDSIADNAFYGDHAEYTGSSKTYYCNDKLSHIDIPNGVKYIGRNAFYKCSNLRSISIPTSVEYIGKEAFSGTSLISFTFPENYQNEYDIGVQDCDTIIWNTISYPAPYLGSNYSGVGHAYTYSGSDVKNTKIKSFIFGDKVENIPNSLCRLLTAITEITIPATVKTIGDYAFADCTGLKNIKIEEGVTTIGTHAFEDCTSITNVNIPNSVTTLGDYCFCNSKITKIVLGTGLTQIGTGAFHCATISKMYCKAQQPPVLGTNALSASTSIGIIYVPKASVEDYRTLWSDYATKIIGYDFE